MLPPCITPLDLHFTCLTTTTWNKFVTVSPAGTWAFSGFYHIPATFSAFDFWNTPFLPAMFVSVSFSHHCWVPAFRHHFSHCLHSCHRCHLPPACPAYLPAIPHRSLTFYLGGLPTLFIVFLLPPFRCTIQAGGATCCSFPGRYHLGGVHYTLDSVPAPDTVKSPACLPAHHLPAWDSPLPLLHGSSFCLEFLVLGGGF